MSMTEKELLEYARISEENAVKTKKTVDVHWQTYYNFYVGRHWKKQDPLKPKPVTNYCQQTVNMTVALLTDTQPRLTVSPFDSSDLYKADFIKQELRSIWELNDCPSALATAWFYSLIYGSGFWKEIWNPDEENIQIFAVHPKYIFPSSDATHLDNTSSLFHVIPLSVKQFNRQFPEFIDKIKPDKKDKSSVTESIAPGIKAGTFTKIAVQDTTGEKTSVYSLDEGGDIEKAKEPMIILKEFWYWSEDDNDYRVALIVGNKLLKDKINPLHRRRDKTYKPRLPFGHFINRLNPGFFWGLSEYSLIGPLQRDLNVLKTAVYDHIRLTGNTPWIADTNADVKAEKLTNLEAIIITKAPGTELRRDAPPPLPPDIFRVLADIKFEMDTLTGVHDVTQGRRPVGLTAGIAIAELQEAAQVPMRFRARMAQSALNRIGHLTVDNIKKFYKGARLSRAVKGMKSKLKSRKAIQNIDGQYDLSFDIESSFVTSRTTKINQAIKLFGMGLLDRRAVLESLDYPDREDIMTRMGTAQALEKAMAAGMVPGMGQPGIGGASPVSQGGRPAGEVPATAEEITQAPPEEGE